MSKNALPQAAQEAPLVTFQFDTQPMITLYDLASTEGRCFSPSVWRVRLLLNYKNIPYNTVFLEFPDIEKELSLHGIPPNEVKNPGDAKYTVPAIYYGPEDRYLMGSGEIAKLLESKHPTPPLILASEELKEIEGKARSPALVQAFRTSVTPREMEILSPRSREYYEKKTESILGFPIAKLLEGDTEEKLWAAAEEGFQEMSRLMDKNKDKGPFILGEQPSIIDFFTAGNMQTARECHEPTWERIMKYPGYKRIYKACAPYLEKKN